MRLINSVLAPYDFSECSQQALEYAALLAESVDAKLHVIHVVDDLTLIAQTTDESFREKTIAEMQTKLAAEAKLGDAKIEATFVTTCGSPPLEIVKYADENDINLIVVGSQGRGAISKMLLGSCTDKVLRLAKVPVLTVRQHETSD
ncbi:MAG: universal stress protein [bacterium]|nr:universal stress protein [bacterium]